MVRFPVGYYVRPVVMAVSSAHRIMDLVAGKPVYKALAWMYIRGASIRDIAKVAESLDLPLIGVSSRYISLIKPPFKESDYVVAERFIRLLARSLDADVADMSLAYLLREKIKPSIGDVVGRYSSVEYMSYINNYPVNILPIGLLRRRGDNGYWWRVYVTMTKRSYGHLVARLMIEDGNDLVYGPYAPTVPVPMTASVNDVVQLAVSSVIKMSRFGGRFVNVYREMRRRGLRGYISGNVYRPVAVVEARWVGRGSVRVKGVGSACCGTARVYFSTVNGIERALQVLRRAAARGRRGRPASWGYSAES